MLGRETLQVRQGKAEDLSQLAEWLAKEKAWTCFGVDYDWALETLSTMEDRLYVGETAGRLVGFFTLRPGGFGNFGDYLRMIAVAEEYRGQGLGNRLMELAEEFAFRDSSQLFLICSEDNQGARRFYEGRGYTQVGVLQDLVLPGHNEILFRKYRKRDRSGKS